MQIYTVFDDNFISMARGFINSHRYFSEVPLCAHVPATAHRAIDFCQKSSVVHVAKSIPNSAKQTSRIIKMECADGSDQEEPIAYLDIDIIFQNDIAELEDLNPNFLWTLSKREGHQTTLRKWKKHYFTSKHVEFARENMHLLDKTLSIEEILECPVRNCGVIYGNRSLLQKLFRQAKEYYLKLLDANKKKKTFNDSDQLCFVLAFLKLKDEVPVHELPLRFNRMPYHQSYDYKDKSGFLVPGNVVLHLNRCKKLGKELVDAWEQKKPPNIRIEDNTRSGIIVPIQTSSVAERALMKNLYSLAVSNKANVYRDEDVGFPIARRIEKLDKIRDKMVGERPAFNRGLFFMFNGFLFMIDHGEYSGNRAQWIIGKYVKPRQLAGIFIEQMDKKLDTSLSKIPIVPLTYGAKEPTLWIDQGVYHNLGMNGKKKHSIYFAGAFGTNKKRKRHAQILSQVKGALIEDRKKSGRLNFSQYMKNMAASHIVWCPAGGRPKTHREIEAMCCEVAVLMPEQHVVEPEALKPDVHYICVKPDYSDAAKKCEHYLSNSEKLKQIAHEGRMWYERNASDYARARYMHKHCIKILGGLK